MPPPIIETTLGRLSDPTADPALRWQGLADLEELLTRHAHFGNHPPYSFHDRQVAALPTRQEPATLRLIAATAARIMADPTEPDPIRVSAAFLLSKTRQKSGLMAITKLIAAPGDLPPELARQCGFAFDTLIAGANPATLGIPLDQVGTHFERRGVPWDRANRRVDVNRL